MKTDCLGNQILIQYSLVRPKVPHFFEAPVDAMLPVRGPQPE
jgi:hypothetical protein